MEAEEDEHTGTGRQQTDVIFRQELDEMERDGTINVWPYRARKDLSISQRRLQNARAYVADRDNKSSSTQEESHNISSPPPAQNVKFLPVSKPVLTEAQKIVRFSQSQIFLYVYIA